MILKIIGSVILAILGLLLLAILLVLLVPVRYRVKGGYHKAFVGVVRITWLLHAVSVLIRYDRGLSVTAKLLGFGVFSMKPQDADDGETRGADAEEVRGADDEETRGVGDGRTRGVGDEETRGADDEGLRGADDGEMLDEDEPGALSDAEGLEISQLPTVEELTLAEEEKENSVEEAGEEAEAVTGKEIRDEIGETTCDDREWTGEESSEKIGETADGGIGEKTHDGTGKEIRDEIGETTCDKAGEGLGVEADEESGDEPGEEPSDGTGASALESILDKIEYRYSEICDKLEWADEKRRWGLRFIRDSRNQKTFRLVWRQGKKLLRHLIPTKASGEITFGFDDPATTGKVLAACSVLYAMYGTKLCVTPDFEHPVMEGNLTMKGRIRLGTAAAMVARVLIHKNLWRMIRQVRGFLAN